MIECKVCGGMEINREVKIKVEVKVEVVVLEGGREQDKNRGWKRAGVIYPEQCTSPTEIWTSQ